MDKYSLPRLLRFLKIRKTLFFSLFFLQVGIEELAITKSNHIKKILIYDDSSLGPKKRGTSSTSILHSLDSFRSLLDSKKYIFERITPSEIILGNKLKQSALLIVPGGRDKPYAEMLKGKGNQNIKDFVINGGSLLGLCAGAYYFSQRVEFNTQDTRFSVNEDRELGFYPGKAIGPALGDYNPFTNIGLKAAEILIEASQKKTKLFYLGGGYFEKITPLPENIKILARYKKTGRAAIVKITKGKGLVLLSSLHPEYVTKKIISSDDISKEVKKELLPYEDDRIKILKLFLKELNISH